MKITPFGNKTASVEAVAGYIAEMAFEDCVGMARENGLDIEEHWEDAGYDYAEDAINGAASRDPEASYVTASLVVDYVNRNWDTLYAQYVGPIEPPIGDTPQIASTKIDVKVAGFPKNQ